jgi:hypothetical protein
MAMMVGQFRLRLRGAAVRAPSTTPESSLGLCAIHCLDLQVDIRVLVQAFNNLMCSYLPPVVPGATTRTLGSGLRTRP